MEITCYDKYGRVIENIVQWDVGQSISIKGYDLTSYAPQIHFANANSEKALVVESVLSGGLLSCQVPNSLARENLPIIMYIYDAVGETGKTNTIIKIPVTPRPMPNDVVYTDDVGVISLTEVLRQAREYMNNSLNYSTKAKESEEKAKTSADAAKVSETNAAKSENVASSSATQAAQSAKEAKAYVGSPLVANTVSAMTDQTKIYVYTGSESGYTAGNWYYHNGSTWVSGGVYNSSAVNVDKTLTQDGYAADAKVTGDAVSSLKGDLGNVFNDLTMLRAQACIFVNESDILGVQVDYKNKTFKRLAGAANLSKGSDFDKFTMFGGRKRCNVADGGSIVAWYGDADYKEDGSMGQVMVYQPKFYYLVCPVEYDPIDTGIGYHLRKANYYVSEKPRAGFRLHPAFYDANGNEIDYFLTSAYEGSIYDASASAYLLNDEQVMNTGEDKFSSIAGTRPATGVSQNLTIPNIEQMAKNRGEGWHSFGIKTASMEQLLMIVEMGMMNLQTAIGQGVVNLPWATGSDTTSSYAGVTGSTASLGNGTGRATETTTYEGGVATNNTADGKTSICYRGVENFWGNIWKFAYGVNIWGNGKMEGGMPYICSDFNYAEGKNTDNYEGAGFTVAPKEGYISAMGYSTKYDWLFIASECLGNSSLPVGDYTWITQNLNGYRIALLGGDWASGSGAGGFYWDLNEGVGSRNRDVGGRLVYVPTKDSSVYNAAIASWKEQMAA